MESRQTELWVDLIITYVAAVVITVLRVVSRRLNRQPFGWDDYFAFCGFVRHAPLSCVASPLQPLILASF